MRRGHEGGLCSRVRGVHRALLLSLSFGPSLQEGGQMLRGAAAVHDGSSRLRQRWVLRRRMLRRLRETRSDLHAVAEELLAQEVSLRPLATLLSPLANLSRQHLQKLLQKLRMRKVRLPCPGTESPRDSSSEIDRSCPLTCRLAVHSFFIYINYKRVNIFTFIENYACYHVKCTAVHT